MPGTIVMGGPAGKGPRTVKNLWSLAEESQQTWTISGITKDSFGTVLGSCVVKLFYTGTDVLVASLLSDAVTGAYKFFVNPGYTFYVVAYKAGPPDVRGTSNNTLLGV